MAQNPAPYVIYTAIDGSESLSFAPVAGKGWAKFNSADTRATGVWVLLRFGRQGHGWALDEPIQIRELQIIAREGRKLGGSTLSREIPFRRLEAAVNRPDHAEAMRELIPSDGLFTDHMPLGGDRQVDWLGEPEAERQQRPRLKLRVPTGYRKPDAFYALVADRFLWLATMSERPAQQLAEANNVPPSTVHRWIREARARGLLQLPTYRGDAEHEGTGR